MRNHKEITLAEFLGWEEMAEYEYRGGIVRVNGWNVEFLNKNGEWEMLYTFFYEIPSLRKAKKVAERKYYAKIKGWELIKNSRFIYWSADSEGKNIFLNDKDILRNCRVASTKSEWEKLGINDSNADFEEIEE